jgi:hypothetical protein
MIIPHKTNVERRDYHSSRSFTSEWETGMDQDFSTPHGGSIYLRNEELKPFRTFQLQRSNARGIPAYESNSAVGPKIGKTRMLNRSNLREYIEDAISADISKYYNNGTFPLDPSKNEGKQVELYVDLQVELETILKDELRRYGYSI